jgi:hypothetical protein
MKSSFGRWPNATESECDCLSRCLFARCSCLLPRFLARTAWQFYLVFPERFVSWRRSPLSLPNQPWIARLAESQWRISIGSVRCVARRRSVAIRSPPRNVITVDAHWDIISTETIRSTSAPIAACCWTGGGYRDKIRGQRSRFRQATFAQGYGSPGATARQADVGGRSIERGVGTEKLKGGNRERHE